MAFPLAPLTPLSVSFWPPRVERKSSNPGSNVPDGFGLPVADDPDPFGVLALQREGFEIKEAGSRDRAPIDAFDYRPSPTSPAFRLSNPVNGETSKRHSRRGSRSSRRSFFNNPSLADQATQTANELGLASPHTPDLVHSPMRSDYEILSPRLQRFSQLHSHDEQEESPYPTGRRGSASAGRRGSASAAAGSGYDDTEEEAEEGEDEDSLPVIQELGISTVTRAVPASAVAGKPKIIQISRRAPPPVPARSNRRFRNKSLSSLSSNDFFARNMSGASISTISPSPAKSEFDASDTGVSRRWSAQTSLLDGDSMPQGKSAGPSRRTSYLQGLSMNEFQDSPTLSLSSDGSPNLDHLPFRASREVPAEATPEYAQPEGADALGMHNVPFGSPGPIFEEPELEAGMRTPFEEPDLAPDFQDMQNLLACASRQVFQGVASPQTRAAAAFAANPSGSHLAVPDVSSELPDSVDLDGVPDVDEPPSPNDKVLPLKSRNNEVGAKVGASDSAAPAEQVSLEYNPIPPRPESRYDDDEDAEDDDDASDAGDVTPSMRSVPFNQAPVDDDLPLDDDDADMGADDAASSVQGTDDLNVSVSDFPAVGNGSAASLPFNPSSALRFDSASAMSGAYNASDSSFFDEDPSAGPGSSFDAPASPRLSEDYHSIPETF